MTNSDRRQKIVNSGNIKVNDQIQQATSNEWSARW